MRGAWVAAVVMAAAAATALAATQVDFVPFHAGVEPMCFDECAKQPRSLLRPPLVCPSTPHPQSLSPTSRFLQVAAGKCTLKKTPQKYVDWIYQMLKDWTEIMRAHGVEWWAEGGTLLGAVRHGGFIPWDDDADVGVPVADKSKLLAAESAMKAAGYVLKPWFYGYKFYPVNGETIPNPEKPFLYPFFDVFMVDFKNGRSYYPGTNLYQNCYFLPGELNPVKDCKFGPLTIRCPNNPTPYFERCYGKDWNSVGYEGKDHRTYSTDSDAPQNKQSVTKFVAALPSGALSNRIGGGGGGGVNSGGSAARTVSLRAKKVDDDEDYEDDE